MKKIITLSLLLCISAYSFAQNEEINAVAQKNLESFLNDIPKAYLKEHGFNSAAEFKSAKLGSQYEIFALGEDGNLTATGFYYINVTVNGENRTLLTVGELDGNLDIQGAGYSDLSKELAVKESNHKTTESLKNIMVIDYPNRAGYVTYESNSDSSTLKQSNYIPLASASEFLGEQNVRVKSTFKLSELVAINKTARSN